ncbi:hypothetical protein TrVGV298_007154 [Trichoderma virens]|nr:hypothetical protein TrVGV298_007154 [Trichoderma virens]
MDAARPWTGHNTKGSDAAKARGLEPRGKRKRADRSDMPTSAPRPPNAIHCRHLVLYQSTFVARFFFRSFHRQTRDAEAPSLCPSQLSPRPFFPLVQKVRAFRVRHRGSTHRDAEYPPPALLPPPEGIFRTFDDLMASVQRVAKDQGYGIVKLRASNYRDGKPTRYDLVCDRGGVKYNSTAKKRNPSTRKIDCPFRAKAVCEVQLGNQWRFALQEPRHNHEPRVPSGTPGQENAPLATSIRSFTNKLDRLSHDMAQGLMRIEQRLDNIEKRMENIEARAGGYEPRFQAIEQRLQGMEGPRMDGMGMDDVESRLLASSVM